ncbi:MAG: hypothetical protein QOK23_4066 [Gammaproteobacteria bacterium]|jgi:hypothetical protein|nr:hypothetical protein [Gammaproteobacteria bacterium]
MLRPWLIRGFGIALVITIVLAGFGNAVLYLWNDVVPAVFGLRTISYWQAVELLGLSWIFFGSWRALPGFPERADDARDHRLVCLTAADKAAARDALSNSDASLP